MPRSGTFFEDIVSPKPRTSATATIFPCRASASMNAGRSPSPSRSRKRMTPGRRPEAFLGTTIRVGTTMPGSESISIFSIARLPEVISPTLRALPCGGPGGSESRSRIFDSSASPNAGARRRSSSRASKRSASTRLKSEIRSPPREVITWPVGVQRRAVSASAVISASRASA